MKEEKVNLKFDPVTLKKLGNYVGLIPDSSFIYVPKVYRDHVKDKGLHPVFTLKCLTNLDKAKLEDHLGYFSTNSKGEQVFSTSTGSSRIFLLKNNILSLKNWYIPSEDKFVSFSQQNGLMPDSFIDQLDPELQRELEQAIKNTETLTDEEKVGLLS